MGCSNVMAVIFFGMTIGMAYGSDATSFSKKTPTQGYQCKKLAEDSLTGALERVCPGVAGNKLIVLEDDERVSVVVEDSAARRWEMNLWDVVSRGFSELGDHVEWVIRGKSDTQPVGLFFPMKLSEQGDLDRPTSKMVYVVIKLAAKEKCVVSVLPAESSMKKAQAQARSIAADSFSMPCLPMAYGNDPASLSKKAPVHGSQPDIAGVASPEKNCPANSFSGFVTKFSSSIGTQKRFSKFPLKRTQVLDPAAEPAPLLKTVLLAREDIQYPMMPNAETLSKYGLTREISNLEVTDKSAGEKNLGVLVQYRFERWRACWRLVEINDQST